MLPVPAVTDGVDEDTALKGNCMGWACITISYYEITLHNKNATFI